MKINKGLYCTLLCEDAFAKLIISIISPGPGKIKIVMISEALHSTLKKAVLYAVVHAD
ncbi:hypothetical protein JW890_00660 [candidate division WOR-3 bacterium]|nr:hypothetical protein [candidate division WOR-3 bacterium]